MEPEHEGSVCAVVYWPKYILGGVIVEYMKDKDIGATDSLKGAINDVLYYIFCMKTPEYMMKLMSTYRV